MTLALIAGTGRLPAVLAAALVAQGRAFVLAELDGFAAEGMGAHPVERFRVERLVPFMARLRDLGVSELVFAGAVRRPRLDPALFDPATAALVPRLLAAFQAGDDATLRAVIALFEDEGFLVRGADAVEPALIAGPGVLSRAAPSEADLRDAARAARIVAALGAVDVGQGAVVAQGLCLAVEALPGTDAMLQQVAGIGDRPARTGLLFKAPKPGQDRRVDLPAIGPATVRAAGRAGLAGIVVEAGGVLLIDRAELVALADTLGLFLWVRDP